MSSTNVFFDVQLKEKYLKLEEKRNVLRQAVKMQNDAIDKLQNENLSLMKGKSRITCVFHNSQPIIFLFD